MIIVSVRLHDNFMLSPANNTQTEPGTSFPKQGKKILAVLTDKTKKISVSKDFIKVLCTRRKKNVLEDANELFSATLQEVHQSSLSPFCRYIWVRFLLTVRMKIENKNCQQTILQVLSRMLSLRKTMLSEEKTG